MPNIESSLIFNSNHVILCELMTCDGAFLSLQLSPHGEDKLGEQVKDWQLHGVPSMYDVTSQSHDGSNSRLFEGRIPLANPSFLLAVRDRLRLVGFLFVTLPESGMEAWEKISALPLSDHERYDMLYTFCALPLAERSNWLDVLGEAITAVTS